MLAHRVLIVEDDHGLRQVLARGLREQGFDVVTASDGTGALKAVDERIAAVVLDIGLPDSDGRDVCQALRARGHRMPVLFLTARDGVSDRLSAFSAGGDDYLGKPFHLAELVARLTAQLRRPAVAPAAAGDPAGLVLDPAQHSLANGPVLVTLTPTEYRLAGCLLAGAGAVVRRRDLVRAGWPDGAQVADNTLDQYVTRLRRRLREVGASRAITTVRGVGYRLS